MSSSLLLGNLHQPTQIQNETTSISPITFHFYEEHEQEYIEGTSNSLPFHVPNVTTANQSKIKRCTCCPFGFHIDLDFIRYCEELAAKGKCDSSKQSEKRYNRKQRKSLEFMLGFEDQWILDIEKELHPSKQHKSQFQTVYEVKIITKH